MEKIDLKLDENNELEFKLMIEGTNEPASAIRFVCEAEDGMSYMFNGETTGEPGEILVRIPPMKGRMAEGTYASSLEVVIDGKFHAPLKVLSQFKSGVRVVAESVRRVDAPKEQAPQVSVSSVKHSKPVVKQPVQNETVILPSKRPTLAEKYTIKKSAR